MSLKLGNTSIGSLYLGSTKIGEAYLGSVKVYGTSQPGLPANTIRCKFSSGYTPTMGDSQTLVDASANIWDIYKSGTAWGNLFCDVSQLEEVIEANTTGVTDMTSMFDSCTSLTSVPLFDTSSVRYMNYTFQRCTNLKSVPLFDTSSVRSMILMFQNCYDVESGALALYQQASSQANPPTSYRNAFQDCGRDTVTGAAELAQIPPSWGGPSLEANTIRCKFASGYTPTMGDSQTLVNASANIWDIYKSGTEWYNIFWTNAQLKEVIAANTTGVTNTSGMFYKCTNLTSVSLFDTSSVTNMNSMFMTCTSLTSVPLFDTTKVTIMSYMFEDCYNVESGALALYRQASTQAKPPTKHADTFKNCGRDTTTGAAELAQIPSSWGGKGA